MEVCLILFVYQSHPKYKLIVAANRDEFFNRPTSPIHFWKDNPEILAGQDLEKLGTWMGVTKTGRFAALTNYRNPNEKLEGKRSRGELVADFLKSPQNPDEYLKMVEEKHAMYPGFNLLVGDRNDLYYYSNVENKVKRVEPGIYGVSNHLLNSSWPKVKRGKEGIGELIRTGDDKMVEQLLTLLADADPAPDDLLPKTGVPLEVERMLSPMFIKSEGYGTRSSTVLLMSDDDVFYKERVFSNSGQSDQQFHFRLPAF